MYRYRRPGRAWGKDLEAWLAGALEKEGEGTWAFSEDILPFESNETLAHTIVAVSSGSDVDGSVKVGFICFDHGILAHFYVSFHPLPTGTDIHKATEVRCRKSPEMDHAETKTNPYHLHLDRSGSSQAAKSKSRTQSRTLRPRAKRRRSLMQSS